MEEICHMRAVMGNTCGSRIVQLGILCFIYLFTEIFERSSWIWYETQCNIFSASIFDNVDIGTAFRDIFLENLWSTWVTKIVVLGLIAARNRPKSHSKINFATNIADQLIINSTMSKTNVRKVFQSLSEFPPAILMGLIPFFGCQSYAVITVICLCCMFKGCMFAA